MMKLTSLKTYTLVAMSAAATTLALQACGGDANAQSAATDANPIEGAWESTVTIKDCTSGAVLTTFTGESLFHRGGTLTADNSTPVQTRGLGMGTWAQTGTGAYTAQFHFLRFNIDGSLAGSQKVVRTITMAADAQSLTSTIAAQQLDVNGALLQPICGSETGTRVY
jgi:hypothetical protein